MPYHPEESAKEKAMPGAIYIDVPVPYFAEVIKPRCKNPEDITVKTMHPIEIPVVDRATLTPAIKAQFQYNEVIYLTDGESLFRPVCYDDGTTNVQCNTNRPVTEANIEQWLNEQIRELTETPECSVFLPVYNYLLKNVNPEIPVDDAVPTREWIHDTKARYVGLVEKFFSDKILVNGVLYTTSEGPFWDRARGSDYTTTLRLLPEFGMPSEYAPAVGSFVEMLPLTNPVAVANVADTPWKHHGIKDVVGSVEILEPEFVAKIERDRMDRLAITSIIHACGHGEEGLLKLSAADFARLAALKGQYEQFDATRRFDHDVVVNAVSNFDLPNVINNVVMLTRTHYAILDPAICPALDLPTLKR
jgi:hypothetical protein